MSDHLIYTIGPSGAGKDSVLMWLSEHLHKQTSVHFARRTIDRPAQVSGEAHESLSTTDFVTQRDQQAFALDWAANRHLYGIRHAELKVLESDHWVFVNGSRGNLEKALDQLPLMVVLHITAPLATLEARLVARNRESAGQIAERLRRATHFEPPNNSTFLEIYNDSTIEEAGQSTLRALCQLPGWG